MSDQIEVVDTAWSRGRFDRQAGAGKILFGRMYEDFAIEASAFESRSSVLCIASAGCTAMQLANHHSVTAVDINPVQLDYARQRSHGQTAIQGFAEKGMSAARAMAVMVGWSAGLLERFVELDDPLEQIAFWHRHLNTLRFRLGFDQLLSLAVLRNVYAAPFLQFLPRRFGAILRGRMTRCFGLHSNRRNPYARALLLGELPPVAALASTRAIEFVRADVADFMQRAVPGSFDGFALSNILDGATPAFQRRLLLAIENAAAPGAIVVLRSFREPVNCQAPNLAANDRSMLWGVVEALPLSNPSRLLQGMS
jgi:hypothetical protein